MAGKEEFDFPGFISALAAVSLAGRTGQVRKELVRMHELTVRDPERKFQQQVYVRRLERLVRHLGGEDVSKELAPTEIRAYQMLEAAPPEPEPAPVGAQGAVPSEETPAAAPPPPEPAAEAPAPAGKDRRTSRRIAMRTKARVRRDAGGASEVIEPLNVSRGGIGFESTAQYELDEIVWVHMHYDRSAPETTGLEARSIIVRVSPQPEAGVFSYGVRFLR